MKKTLLSLLAGTMLFSSAAMAYDEGDWYYSPTRYVKSYLFSIDFSGELKYSDYENSDYDPTFSMGLSSRYISYFGETDLNWGVLANLEFGSIKSDNIDDTIGRVSLDVGPTLGYNITKKTNIYGTGGYSLYYANDFEDKDDFQAIPYFGGGIAYFMNDDLVFNVTYKRRMFEDSPWGPAFDMDQINFGLKITYR